MPRTHPTGEGPGPLESASRGLPEERQSRARRNQNKRQKKPQASWRRRYGSGDPEPHEAASTHPEALGLMVEHRRAPMLGVLYQQHIGSFWKS